MSKPERWMLVEYHGDGEIRAGGQTFGRGPFRLQRQQNRPDAPLTFEAFVKTNSLKALVINNEFSFEGRRSLGGVISIPRLRAVRVQSGDPVRFTAEVPEIKVGFDSFSNQVQTIELSAEITHSGGIPPRFALETYADDGRILGEFPSSPQEIPTALGMLIVQESYRFDADSAQVAGTYIRNRSETAVIQVRPECFTCDIESLMERFRPEIEDLCVALGFLGRRLVEWHTLRAQFLLSTGSGDDHFQEAEWIRAASEPDTRRLSSVLINPSKLPSDGLARFVSGLRTSPIAGAIRLSIEYLNSSIRQAPLEARLVSVFTALEAIVSAATESTGTAYTMEVKPFKKLASKIRQEIRTYFTQHGLDPDMMVEACDKVSELQRRPIVPRTMEVLEQNGIVHQDLWPVGTNLKDGLATAYRIRNQLVHAGQIVDRDTAERARLRIHALTERLIYKMLGGEEVWLDPHAYIQASRLQGAI